MTIPINVAEAVIEPFWDPLISGFDSWALETNPDGSVSVEQGWCFLQFAWEGISVAEKVFTMRSEKLFDTGGYDTLLVSLVVTGNSEITVTAAGADGSVRSGRFRSDGRKHEYPIRLHEGAALREIEISITAGMAVGSGWFNWLGLQDSRTLDRYLGQFVRLGETIEDHLRTPVAPSFEPAYSLLVDSAELRLIGERIPAPPSDLPDPGELVNDFIHTGTDDRYNREREHGRALVGLARRTALAGAALRDADLLRRAAGYAVATLLCPHWDWGMVSRFPGSSFEIRSFIQGEVLEDLAITIDLAREYLSESTVQLVFRRIAEDGLGNVSFVSWKHEYIHHCNQLAAFSTGRMAAFALLERMWPRIEPYTEIAYRELIDSLGEVVLSDGGFVEGPSYFHYTMERGLRALRYYSSARGRRLADVVPDRILGTGGFAGAVFSTDSDQDHLPICDAHPEGSLESLAALASLIPGSAWTLMFRKRYAAEKRLNLPHRSPGWMNGALAEVYEPSIPTDAPSPDPFIYLPEMRLAASLRLLDGAAVKIAVLGNRAGAGHTHEDKGSFILELAGRTFAMDPGICTYDNPMSFLLKTCQRHNMLVPYGIPGRPHPSSPIDRSVEITASGDGTFFRSEADLEAGWEGIYRSWHRSIDSPTPREIVIHDRYELVRGDGVMFLWNTLLPVERAGRMISIDGGSARVVITPPEGSTVEIVDLPLPESDRPQRQIRFAVDRTAGELRIEARLEVF